MSDLKDLHDNLSKFFLSVFKRQPYRMVEHTEIICWLLPANCFSVFDHFGGLALKGLRLV